MDWLPLYINPRGLKIAVFGGGRVATRRALMFASAGAIVDVYALEFTPELVEASREGLVRLHKVDLRTIPLEGLIKGASIVVVATSDEYLNEEILSQARNMQKLINYPPMGQRGNVIVPFRGETSYGLRFAITSLGETGIGARRARDKLKNVLESDDDIRKWYIAMKQVKKLLKRRVLDYKLRYSLYFEIEADKTFSSLVEEGRLEDALSRALEIIELRLQSSRSKD